MKSIVIDYLRRELLIRNKKDPFPFSFFSASIQKGPKLPYYIQKNLPADIDCSFFSRLSSLKDT
jgi:hypothetical protein